MTPDEFRRHGHALVDWVADYLAHPERYPVLSRVEPGAITAALPADAPDRGESFEALFADFERVLVPGLTHWNQPGFMAYFASTASAPGILAELLSAALNQQAMLWRTSPAATELESVTLGWLRRLLGLPDAFAGVIYDTASISTLHALACARERAVPGVRVEGLVGRALPRMRVYASAQAHSSVDKAVMLLGLGQTGLAHVPVDDAFCMRPDALREAIARDRADGVQPLAVVATLGTTATTSVDPVAAIAEICEAEGLWLHVDAAYAGAAAMLPDQRAHFAGWERADSVVVNPHKWLFTPFDLSAFYTRHPALLRAAFSLVPDYLRTADAEQSRNLMDTGIQLGRRFRALKLWAVLRHFGAEGLRDRLAGHIALARMLADWIEATPGWERVAPVPFSVVCFRATPADVPDDGLDAFNERLVEAVNATGEVFLSHTRLKGQTVIRLAIGHEGTTAAHVTRAWALLQEQAVLLTA